MNFQAFSHHIYDLTEEERLYRELREAREAGTLAGLVAAETERKPASSRNPETADGELQREQRRPREGRTDYDLLAEINAADRSLIIPELSQDFGEDCFYRNTANDPIVLDRAFRFAPPVRHEHNAFEVTFVYDGKCRLHMDAADRQLCTGDVFFMAPGVPHSIEVGDDAIVLTALIKSPITREEFHKFLSETNPISTFLLSNAYGSIAQDSLLFHTRGDEAISKSFLRMLHESICRQEFHTEIICNTMVLLFRSLLRSSDYSSVTSDKCDAACARRHAVVNYIQQNYRTVTIGDVAAQFLYTPEYTSKIIRETTGQTFTQIRGHIRMEHAKSMLRNTNLSIRVISEKVGYRNPEHFIRMFQKNEGKTPTEYRNKWPKPEWTQSTGNN